MAVDSRLGWLDATKGLGILFVVIGHALGGLVDAPLGEGALLGRQALFAIYSFHMPLFFLLAGLLVSARLEKSPEKFQKSLITGIVWPYLLWSCVQITIVALLGGLVNNPEKDYWATIFSLPWKAVSQFWFLYSLLLLHLLSLACLRKFGALGFFVLTLMLPAIALIEQLPMTLQLTAVQAPFYGLGVLCAARGLESIVVKRSVGIRAIILPLVATALIGQALMQAEAFWTRPFVTLTSPDLVNLARRILIMPAAIGGALAVVGLASLAQGALKEALVYLGQRTMAIYVLHIMGLAGARIVLTNYFHLHSFLSLLPLIVAAGITGPLLVEHFAQKARLGRALGLA